MIDGKKREAKKRHSIRVGGMELWSVESDGNGMEDATLQYGL